MRVNRVGSMRVKGEKVWSVEEIDIRQAEAVHRVSTLPVVAPADHAVLIPVSFVVMRKRLRHCFIVSTALKFA